MSKDQIGVQAQKSRSFRGWRLLLPFIIVAAIVCVAYPLMRPKAEVVVTHPTYQDIESSVSTDGTVVPVNDYPARANFSGLVERIYVKVGQEVHPGQMLVRMKDQYAIPRLESARAALKDAEVNQENVVNNGSQEDRIAFVPELERAKTEQEQSEAALAEMRQLLVRGSVSAAEVEAAEQRAAIAEANLTATRKRMRERYSPQDIASWRIRIAADQANVAAEKVSWANANISSPIAGEVYLLGVHPYDFVPAGTDLVHVADLNRMQVTAEFEEEDLAKLHVGEPVQITWDGAPGRIWHGHVQTKPLAVTRNGARRVGQCAISLDDNRGDLPVDTNVALVATVQRRAHVLVIPHEALHTDGGYYVYLVAEGRLKKTAVVVGLSNAMSVEVVRGISLRDTVVVHTTGDSVLAGGLRVTTRK
jgi:HlyD family secretion protein